ncbi:MAG: hypothetical protein CSA18_01770 [Deltaproteobacteria bacterium]|nr:MAG: hypothetical protein CSA18_01770 [Deltaproteobacteria bacterium]
MPLFYIIRHGQASFGKSDYDCLSDKGVRQSQKLGEFFKKTETEFNCVYSGSLARQKDTAFHTLDFMGVKNKDVEVLEGFNEYDHLLLINSAVKYFKAAGISFETDLIELSKDKKKFQSFFSDLVQKWIAGEFLQGENSYENYSAKVLSAFEKISATCEKNQKIAVFTSGGPISVLLEKSLGIDSFRAVETGWAIANCSVSVFSTNGRFIKDKKMLRLRSFNSTAHFELLEKDMITYR